jgi:hypothetical protein
MLGSLSHVIRSAAVDAIQDGTEKITKAHLQAILLDHQAEHASTSASVTDQPKRRRRGAA